MEWILRFLIRVGIKLALELAGKGAAKAADKVAEKKVTKGGKKIAENAAKNNEAVSSQSDAESDADRYFQSSVSFFQEGIEILQQIRLTRTTTTTTSTRESDGAEAASNANVGNQGDLISAVYYLIEYFARPIDCGERLNSVLVEKLNWAKVSFRSALEDATRSFHRQDTMEQRINATILRVTSCLLGNLREPSVAAIACKHYLKELNSIPEISHIFSRYFEHRWNYSENQSEEETGMISLVVLINYIVFEFSQKLEHEQTTNWPRIPIFGGHLLHPVLNLELDRGLLKKANFQYGIPTREYVAFDSSTELSDPVDMAVNSEGQFIIADLNANEGKLVKVFNSEGVFLFAFAAPPSEEENVYEPQAVSTDIEDNIFLYTKVKDCSESKVLFVFKKNGELIRQVSIENGNYMALHRNTNRMAFSSQHGILVYENDNLLVNLEIPLELVGPLGPLTFSNEGEVIVTHTIAPNISIIRGTNMHQLVTNEAGAWKYIAFNHMTDEIIISYLSKELSHFRLQSYSKAGYLLGSVDLPAYYLSHPRALTITPNGRIALLYLEHVHLI